MVSKCLLGMRNMVWAFLCGMMLCACGGDKTTARFDGVEFDSVVIDTVAKLGTSADAPKCELKLSIQYAKGDHSQPLNDTLMRSGILVPDYSLMTGGKWSVRQLVDSFTCKYLSDYKRDYGRLYQEDTEHGSSYNCQYFVRTETLNGGNDVLNYMAHVYLFGGGEHGIHQTIVKNFDIKTGHLFTLDDVFVSGYEASVKEMILDKLLERFDVKTLDELQKKYIFADGNVYIPDNFILDEDQLTFIYCEDEIAPHDIGEIRVDFDKGDLKKYMR